MIAEAQPQIEPGIYDAVTRAVYESWPAANYSMLKMFGDNAPAKVRYLMANRPEPTDALNLGSALHTSILEPDKFGSEYIKAPKCDRRTNQGKERWRQFIQDEVGGRTALAPEDYDTALEMSSAIWRSEMAKGLLSSMGKTERSFFWIDEPTKQACKGRLDKMVRWMGWTFILDLKTCQDASERSFSKDIAKYHYDAQAAFYLDGLNAIAPANAPRRWLWIAIEKNPPYLVQTFEPEDRCINQGRLKYRKWLDIYRECVTSNVWPGYPEGIVPIDVPRWAQEDEAVVTFQVA